MDITHYTFATYIFLLIVLGVWFLGKVVFRAGKDKGGKSAYEKEQRLFMMYQNLEEMLSGFEQLAEETKKSTQETLEKSEQALKMATEMIEEAGGMPQKPKTAKGSAVEQPGELPDIPLSEQPNMPEPAQEQETIEKERASMLIEEEPAPKMVETEEESGSAISPLKQNEKIRLLSAQGLTSVEIAKTLGISVREVTLALQLGRK